MFFKNNLIMYVISKVGFFNFLTTVVLFLQIKEKQQGFYGGSSDEG